MVFRSMFADIGDEQSIEASLSSFAAHIANLSEMRAALDEPALVILDEPGEGTDPAEGAALAIGLMTYLGRGDAWSRSRRTPPRSSFMHTRARVSRLRRSISMPSGCFRSTASSLTRSARAMASP